MEDSSFVPNPETQSERQFTSLLIDLYRASPELWQVKSQDYFNRRKRNAALESIVATLRTFKPDYTVGRVKQKINSLRTNFNREHKAVEARITNNDTPQPTLWYYNELSFIKDQIEVLPIENSEPILCEDSEPLPALQNTIPSFQNTQPTVQNSAPNIQNSLPHIQNSLPHIQNSGPHIQNSLPHIQNSLSSSTRTELLRRRKRRQDSSEQLTELAIEFFKRRDTEEDILAKSWAMKLKKLAPDQKCFAEKIINDTLFEAEMGTLTRHGVNFVTEPDWSLLTSSSSSTRSSHPKSPIGNPTYTESNPTLPNEQSIIIKKENTEDPY